MIPRSGWWPRRSAEYGDAASELYEAAARNHPGFAGMAERKQAQVICAMVMRLRVSAFSSEVVLRYVSPAGCFAAASLYRLGAHFNCNLGSL